MGIGLRDGTSMPSPGHHTLPKQPPSRSPASPGLRASYGGFSGRRAGYQPSSCLGWVPSSEFVGPRNALPPPLGLPVPSPAQGMEDGALHLRDGDRGRSGTTSWNGQPTAMPQPGVPARNVPSGASLPQMGASTAPPCGESLRQCTKEPGCGGTKTHSGTGSTGGPEPGGGWILPWVNCSSSLAPISRLRSTFSDSAGMGYEGRSGAAPQLFVRNTRGCVGAASALERLWFGLGPRHPATMRGWGCAATASLLDPGMRGTAPPLPLPFWARRTP